jgi:glutaminyl-tRNA synthetase
VIENLSENYELDCNHPHIPNKPEFYHTTKITNEIFIEKDDFKLEHDNDFYRLSPKNEKVRLKFFDIVKYVKFENNIIYTNACNIKRDKKVKSTIHWISSKHAIPAKFVFIDEINPLLKNTFDGYIEKYVLELIELDENTVFEFERIGYFKLLKKDVNNLLCFLCIVTLK